MSDPCTLVFGDDSSPASDTAFSFVNSQRWPGWRLEIVVAQRPEIPGAALPHEVSELHEWKPPQPRSVSAAAEFAQVAELTATADPRLVLSRACDLLVIGPRGPGLLKSLHLGSTADWLLLHPPAPLLIARSGDLVRRVVICVDGSPHSVKATNVVAHLPWVAELEVTVLAIDDQRVDVKKATANATQQLESTGATVHVQVDTGKPTTAIHHYLDETSPDLVVLGTSGLTGLRHLRVGSTASSVARTASCSVLVACDEDEYARTTDGNR